MKRLKQFFIMLYRGISFAPICSLIYLFVNILRATIVVFMTVILADLVDSTVSMIQDNGTFQDVVPRLLLFGALTIFVWILVSLRFRLADDVLPAYSQIGVNKYLFKQIEYVPLKQFDNSAFCDALEIYRAGINRLPNFVRHIFGLITSIYSLALTCIEFLHINWIFCLITILFTIISYFSTRKNAFVMDNLRTNMEPLQRKKDYLFSMSDGIYNRETRLYGIQSRYSKKILELQEQMLEMDFNAGSKIGGREAVVAFLKNGLCPLINLIIAAILVVKSYIDIGSVFFVWSLSTAAMSGSGDLIANIVESAAFMLEYDDVERFEKNIVKEIRDDTLTQAEETPILRLEHVSFSYLPDSIVLDDITLHMEKGETVAILGENGSGKSTLIKLILGYYKPDKGSVTLTGHELYNCSESYIRANFGVTFQDYCQFPATLRENVGFGDLEHIHSDDFIINALNKADCHTVFEKSHSNLETMLGRELDDNGIELSGGEWQKIALARMYASSKNIMILDEPAAKLDPLAEVRQFEQVKKYAEGKLLIMVSHRVGFARLADRIILMKNGHIAEQGSHDELMSQKGIYFDMFSAQKRMYENTKEV